MAYPIIDIFFEVIETKKFWVPVDSTFCKGSITLRGKEKLLRESIEDFELFLYIDDKESVREVRERFGNTVCKWTGLNASELVYIIEKEWELNTQSEDV